MATRSIASSSTAVASPRTRRHFAVTDWGGGWRVSLLLWLGVTVLFMGLSTYMHAFAWSTGLDSSSPEFARFWHSLLIVELVRGAVGPPTWWAWLVRSGRTVAAALTPAEEVRRIAVFWGLV